MRVADIIIVICCPLVITAKLSENINSASAKFRRVYLKPSGLYLTAEEVGKHHISQCTKACLFTADCLTTVFDEDLGRCSLYNSSTITESLSDGETAVMKEVSTNEVLCVALKYNQDVGGCVQMFTSPKSWEEAQTACQRLHQRSHLVTITDERKQLALNTLADSAGVTRYYTAGQATQPWSDHFVWATTGEDMSYTNWASGEPNNYGGKNNEDCLAPHKDSVGFRWADIECNREEAYVCELE